MTEHTPTTVMAKADKKELDEALNAINHAKSVIESLAEHYREKFDDLSEKAQEGERGTAIDEAASELEGMNDSLDEIIDTGATLVG